MRTIQATALWVVAALVIYYVQRIIAVSRSRARLSAEHNCQPPRRYPSKDPFFGLDRFLSLGKAWEEKRFIARVGDDFLRLGPTFVANNVGTDNVITMDPENIRALLKSDFDTWGLQSVRKASLEPFFGDKSLFILDDKDLWRRSRNHIKQALGKAEYSNFPRLEVYVERFLELIPMEGSTCEVSTLFERLILDYMSSYIFGESIDSMTLHPTHDQKRINHAFSTASEVSIQRTHTEAAFGGTLLRLLPVSKEFSNACATVQEYIYDCIDSAAARMLKSKSANVEEPSDTHLALVEKLVESTQDKAYLRGLLTTLFSGATDTTATLLSNTIFNLSRAPAVLTKVRAEIATLQGRAPDYTEIQKLPYLRATINETLRATPVVPLTARIALKDTVLPTGGGKDGKSPFLVKKGTVMGTYFANALHNPKVWGKDADAFRPERWLEMEGPAPWTFTPFGGGDRVCPGQHVAQATASYVLVRMLQRFKGIESRDDRPFVPLIRLATSNANGYHVTFIPEKN